MLHDPSSSVLNKTTSRRRFTNAAVLVPIAGVLSATAFSAQSLLAHAQTPRAPGLQLAQSAPGIWSPTGSLLQACFGHTATLLSNGQVLVAAGNDSFFVSAILTSAELYDPATGSLTTGREEHTATLLSDGRVLVAGGQDPSHNGLTSAEIYNPATGSWTAPGSLIQARFSHTATLLSNGQVLIAGGDVTDSTSLASAELFDPAATLPPNIAGNYQGTMTSDPPNDRTENVTLQVTQSGSQLQATLRMTEGTFPLRGTITGQGIVTMATFDNRVSLSGQTFGQGDLEGSYATALARNPHGQWQVSLG